MDDKARKSASQRTGQLVVVVIFAFLLGAWTADFRGGWLHWTGLVLVAAALALNLFTLVRAFWKSGA